MKRFPLLFLLLFTFLFTGCYYTAQSYNHGKLLDPGNSMFTFGAGASFQSSLIYQNGPYDYSYDYDPDYYYIDTLVQEKKLWRNIALNYQLGVHDRYPFGGGLEVGLLWEFSYYKDFYGTASDVLPALDFNVRCGFRDVVLPGALFQHNVEIGWTTGMWVDNGMFLGYAAGWEFQKIIPYVGLRAIYMPTNLLEHEEWIGEFENHDQKFNLRGALGASVKLKKMPFFPDYITPELTLVGPNASVIDDFNATFHVGFRWTNGL